MSAATNLQPVEETRGQIAKRRRIALGVARDRVAHEARVSVKTVKSYEEDARENMPSGSRIEDALDRLEAAPASGTPARRSSDTPQRRALEALIETREGEQVAIRLLGDGTRAIFVVPEGGRIPSDAEIQAALRQARGEQ